MKESSEEKWLVTLSRTNHIVFPTSFHKFPLHDTKNSVFYQAKRPAKQNSAIFSTIIDVTSQCSLLPQQIGTIRSPLVKHDTNEEEDTVQV